MKDQVHLMQEQEAAKAFNRQAPVFDIVYSGNTIIQYKRKRVRDHVNNFLPPQSNILELNAGTGEDAVYFAQSGHRVHATDVSQGMQDVLKEKIENRGERDNISYELCSFTSLEQLEKPGPYDLIFSNFAGLNCTAELDRVMDSFSFLLKPGGFVTLVILPKFCLWEFLLLFKGKFRTAFRRFSGKRGSMAKVEGESFHCWYYNASFIKKRMKHQYKVIKQEGLCTLVPPSYIEGFAEKHPAWYRFLQKAEDRRKASWPWRGIGDYFIITLQKKY